MSGRAQGRYRALRPGRLPGRLLGRLLGRFPGRFLAFGPSAWLTAFVLIPFALVAKISLSRQVIAQPPYEPTFSFADGWSGVVAKLSELSFDAYEALASDDIYLLSYLSSLRVAAVAAVFTLLVAYPLALAIARAPRARRPALVMLAVAPFWTSFLIRVYAWILILKEEGLLNRALLALGLISQPLQIFATEPAVIIGMVYSYLPFMILPIYAALEGQDGALVDAAADLGASPTRAFWRVTFPLSLKGVAAGCVLVFIPAVGEFVIPDLLGGSDMLMIGRALWTTFFSNRDWPGASAVAIVLLALILPALWLYERAHMREGKR
jgi:putrescine transport system permease protein